MSTTPEAHSRREILDSVAVAGRELSDAIVLFHARAAERFGLGTTDWKALGLISRHGPLTHGELARHLGLKPASVTNILDRLEAKAWIRRQKGEGDARRISISVNEEKVAAFQGRVFGKLAERLDSVYGRYTDEELALLTSAMLEIAEAQKAALDEL